MLPKIHANNAWLAGHPDAEAVPLDARPGVVYRFRGHRDARGRPVYPAADYRCLGVGLDVNSWQERVAYVGAGGPDDGNLYFASLADWAANFTPAEAVTPGEEPDSAKGVQSLHPPSGAAPGAVTAGSGV